MFTSSSIAELTTNEIYYKFDKLSKGGMLYDQHLLIAETIETIKPRKILEIGVQLGCTSAFILEYLSLRNMNETKLDSIDIISQFKNPNTGLINKIGEEVEKHNAPTKNWRLLTGAPIVYIYDKVQTDYDLCIIDTSHKYPGEIIDFLSSLPLLSKEATVFIHDIAMTREGKYSDVTSMLFSAIPGKKKIPETNYFHAEKPNIGCIKLDPDIFDKLLGVFNLLTVTWQFPLDINYLNKLHSVFNNIYTQDCMRLFTIACYKFTNSDINLLSHNNCPVCTENNESTATIANENGNCQRCKSTSSERIFRKFINENPDFFSNKSILLDKSSKILSKQSINNSKDIIDFSFYNSSQNDKYDIIILDYTTTSKEICELIISNINSILSEDGALLFIGDKSALMSTNFNRKIYYSADFLTGIFAPIYILSKKEITLENIMTKK